MKYKIRREMYVFWYSFFPGTYSMLKFLIAHIVMNSSETKVKL